MSITADCWIMAGQTEARLSCGIIQTFRNYSDRTQRRQTADSWGELQKIKSTMEFPCSKLLFVKLGLHRMLQCCRAFNWIKTIICFNLWLAEQLSEAPISASNPLFFPQFEIFVLFLCLFLQREDPWFQLDADHFCLKENILFQKGMA